MRHKKIQLAGAFISLLFLTACGSSGGGLGDIFGGGSDNSGVNASEIRGTVDYVDTNDRSVVLTNVSQYSSNLNPGTSGGQTVRVYFDDRTPVDYQGRAYRVTDLERGDEIAVRLDRSNNRLYADSVRVLYDARGGQTSSGGSIYGSGGNYGSSIRGTIRSVDTSRRTIMVDRSFGGDSIVLDFDTATAVTYNGQRYRVEDLERGDEIEIRYRDFGNGRLLAQDVTVTRSVSTGSYGSGSTGTSGTSRLGTVRGTVQYVDTSRGLIEINQASWANGFTASRGTTAVLQYSSNMQIEVSGQRHPISGLERGDVIEAEVRDDGGSRLIVERIFLVRDVNAR